jgi:hypothetical protein
LKAVITYSKSVVYALRYNEAQSTLNAPNWLNNK